MFCICLNLPLSVHSCRQCTANTVHHLEKTWRLLTCDASNRVFTFYLIVNSVMVVALVSLPFTLTDEYYYLSKLQEHHPQWTRESSRNQS